jgi:hypothetical protein
MGRTREIVSTIFRRGHDVMGGTWGLSSNGTETPIGQEPLENRPREILDLQGFSVGSSPLAENLVLVFSQPLAMWLIRAVESLLNQRLCG